MLTFSFSHPIAASHLHANYVPQHDPKYPEDYILHVSFVLDHSYISLLRCRRGWLEIQVWLVYVLGKMASVGS